MSSVTSCPQCSRQVTIPAGVDTSAKVRCPLCHSQYSLSDALVNMPPLLELVDATSDWSDIEPELDDRDEQGATGMAETLEFAPRGKFEDDASPDLDELSPPAGHDADTLGLGEPLDEELTSEEKDTEVEELGFTASDPLLRAVPVDSEPIEMAGEDEDSVLEFDSQTPPGIDAGTPPRDRSQEGAATLDFDDMAPMEDEIAFDADSAAPARASDEDEIVFDMAAEETSAASDDDRLGLDLNPTDALAAGGDGEIGLDFGEAIEPEAAPMALADTSAPDAADEQPEGKKSKKKKKKEKAAAEPGRKRPLSTALSVLLGAVVAVPLALFGLLWMGPDYDLIGMGRMLPAFMVPGSFNKQYAANRPVQPNFAPPSLPAEPEVADPSATPAEAPAQPPADAPAPDAAPTQEPAPDAPADTTPPSAEPAPSSPADDPSAETPSEPAPAEPTPSEPAPAEPAPSDEPSAARPAPPSVDPFEENAKGNDAASKEMPEKPAAPPADEPAAPSLPAPDAPAPSLAPPADAASKPVPSEELPSPTDSPTPPAAPAGEPLGPIAPPAIGVAELAKALSDATVADQKMVAAMATGDEAQMKKVRSPFYLSMFRLAEAATFAKDDSGSGQLDVLRQGLEQLVRQLAADTKRTDSLKFNSGVWLAYPKRSTHGIVLAGKVQSAARAGKLYEVKLAIGLDTEAPIVTIVAAQDSGLAAGDHALVMGTIIENPREQIAGYEGAEPSVVWNAVTLKDDATR